MMPGSTAPKRTVPLIRNFAPGAVFAYYDGGAVSVEEYLRDVRRLAHALPQGRHVLNLCTNRYRFCVAFAAALLRDQVNLLPPNQVPLTIAQLRDRYAGAFALVDDDASDLPITIFRYPVWTAGSETAAEESTESIPVFPADQMAAITFSSGSTGEPVPHQKTWGALAASVAECGRPGARHPGATIIGTVPPQHMYGLESTVLMVMQNGLTLHSARPFYPADIISALAAVPRPRALVTTPFHLRTLIADATEMPAVDFLLCATAPLSPQLAAAAESAVGAPLYEIYGCTEAGQVATRRTVQSPVWETLPGLEIYQDQRGTWVCGEYLADATLLSDVIELQGGGRFLLHGRLADVVNIAGKRTSLAYLNYHLNSIEGVRDGVFMPQGDDGSGPVVRMTAFVVAPGVGRDTLLRALRQRIDDAFLPRPLHLVDMLPRNATGKLPRQALSELMTRAASGAG